ncbi:domain found in IF2B/IF5-domain-containing protein [Limtongia smithiae]|uniref:domain found in IF2B/IF5-domain-containing protein n=1 Tax=Limtongia smithiae TaxID=1125753 RepID=UPI0034CDC089
MASVEDVPAAEVLMDFDSSLKKKKKKSKVAFTGDEFEESAAPKVETPDPAVDELTDMFAGMKKKKKKSSSTSPAAEADEAALAEVASAPTEEVGEDFDFTKKKKKKKATAAIADVDEFEQQLEEAGLGEDDGGEGEEEDDGTFAKEGEEDIVDDDDDEHEAAWLNSDRDYTYDELLHRFFKILRTNNPELAGERGQRYKIPPPSVMREGNKKTIFANLQSISERMHRPYEHVMQFLFAELGTSGSVDGSARLVIKGRFQQKQLENVLRRYIVEYVTCKTCKSINTKLAKENRLYFVVCDSCGSRRSVSGIKTGFQAHIGKRKKMPG